MAHYQSLKWIVNNNQIMMTMMDDSDLMKAYNYSNKQTALFSKDKENYPPLTFQDSLTHVPNYPFCTLGVLNAEAEWGKKRGIAFVVEDNYLLTCASNCYSHKHRLYTNITFTIASNKKHGSDTYKIAKVFIPWQYKTFPLDTRDQHNYALLYIQGEPNLKDKYGSLKIVKDKNFQNSFTFHCAIDDQNELQMISKLMLSSNTKQMDSKFLPNGMPRLRWNKKNTQNDYIFYFQHSDRATKWNNAYAQVEGLIFQSSKNRSLHLLKFDENFGRQLAQWVKVQKGQMSLNGIPAEGFDMSCFKGVKPKPLGTLFMGRCKADHKKTAQILKQLPFSSVSQVYFNNQTVYQDKYKSFDVGFLSMDKFANLKELTIEYCKIGPDECKYIAAIPLPNLRRLDLSRNTLKYKGCEYLSTGKWPFLQILYLRHCSIDCTALQILMKFKFKNLLSLDLKGNHLCYEASQVFRMAVMPRISVLNMDRRRQYQLASIDLRFLKASTWRQLSDINFGNFIVGNRGCKMIKQSACALIHLNLEKCYITDLGVKWLCKINTSRMITLNLNDNRIGYQSCLYLTKTNFPTLVVLEYSKKQIFIFFRLSLKSESNNPANYSKRFSKPPENGTSKHLKDGGTCKLKQEKRNLLEAIVNRKQ